MADDAAVENAGDGGAGVHQDEANGAADGGVGAVARSEQVVAGVDVQVAHHGAVDDGQDGRAAHAGGRADEVEDRVEHGLGGSEHDGHVLGEAAGHHGVGRDLADGDLAAALWELADHLAGGSAAALDELRDAGLGGRDDGQAVSPAELVATLDGLEGRVPLDGCGLADFSQGLIAPVRGMGSIRLILLA